MKGDLIGLPLCLSRASKNFGQLAIFESMISIHIQIAPVFTLFFSPFVCCSTKSSHALHAQMILAMHLKNAIKVTLKSLICLFEVCQNSSDLVVPSWQRKIPKRDATLKYVEVLTCLDHTGEGRLVMSDETRTLHWGRQRRLGLVEVLTSFLSHREASICVVWY